MLISCCSVSKEKGERNLFLVESKFNGRNFKIGTLILIRIYEIVQCCGIAIRSNPTGYTSFFHHLQQASHNLASIWQKKGGK